MGERRRTVVVHQPGMGQPHAQGVVDDIADGGAVTRPCEAMGQSPVLKGVGHRSLARFDIGKYFDGPLKPAAQTHSTFSCLRIARKPSSIFKKAKRSISVPLALHQSARNMHVAADY